MRCAIRTNQRTNERVIHARRKQSDIIAAKKLSSSWVTTYILVCTYVRTCSLEICFAAVVKRKKREVFTSLFTTTEIGAAAARVLVA